MDMLVVVVVEVVVVVVVVFWKSHSDGPVLERFNSKREIFMLWVIGNPSQ